jgi:leucine dehydrogenase
VINAGGAIYGMDSVENPEPNVARAERKVLKIYEYVAKTLEIAKECGIPTYKAAESMAEERINEVRKAKKLSS